MTGNTMMSKENAFVRVMLLTALVVATTVSTSSAQAVSNWFDGRGPTRVVYYHPVAAANYVTPYSVGYRGVPYTVRYQAAAPVRVAPAIPRTVYRTRWGRIPVTTYRPVVTQDPATGAQVTQMMPCTTTRWQVYRVPVTTYRPRWNWGAWRNWCIFRRRQPIYAAPPAYAMASPCDVPQVDDGWTTVGASNGNATDWQPSNGQSADPGNRKPSLDPNGLKNVDPLDPSGKDGSGVGAAGDGEQTSIPWRPLSPPARSVIQPSGRKALKPLSDPDADLRKGPKLNSGRAPRTALAPPFQSAPIARASYTVAQPRQEAPQQPSKKTKWSNSDWRAK